MNNIWKHVSTDYDNKTYETGRVIGIAVMATAIVLSGYDVIGHAAHFDAQSFLLGCGGFLTGLGAYLWGDAKGKEVNNATPQATTTTTTTVIPEKTGDNT